jgi:uncharacterized cupredoxin-like copper-binding protein
MTRLTNRVARSCIVAVCLSLSLFGLGATAGAHTRPSAQSAPRGAKPAPEHLLIYAQEWSLWPSRTKLKPGTVDVQFWNRGQDSHDVVVRRLDAQGKMVGKVLDGVSLTPPGDIHSAVWHLKAGKYEIYCSLPGHLLMGMHAKLTVKS